jgi:acetylglutamate kinase
VGKINKELVSLINRHGRLAVGLSGDDGNLIMAEPKTEPAGLGYVGEVKKVNTKVLTDLIEDDFIPVIASIGAGPDGKSYNINADTVAGEVAAAIKADKVIFLTDVEGLYRDFNDKETLISSLSLKECEAMVQKNEIAGGMLPKVSACIQALKAGVKRAHILNGTTEHALLLEIFTNEGIGTMIVG